jgi:hypothetical protein
VSGVLFKDTILRNYSLKKWNSSISNVINAQTLIKWTKKNQKGVLYVGTNIVLVNPNLNYKNIQITFKNKILI